MLKIKCWSVHSLPMNMNLLVDQVSRFCEKLNTAFPMFLVVWMMSAASKDGGFMKLWDFNEIVQNTQQQVRPRHGESFELCSTALVHWTSSDLWGPPVSQWKKNPLMTWRVANKFNWTGHASWFSMASQCLRNHFGLQSLSGLRIGRIEHRSWLRHAARTILKARDSWRVSSFGLFQEFQSATQSFMSLQTFLT